MSNMNSSLSLTHRNVLVAGGTSGIGAGIAHAFLQAGAQVTLTGATDAEAQRARSDPLLAGAQVQVLDVRQSDAVQACVAQFQQLDVLVNCAGVIRRGQEHDPEVFAQVIDINLQGTMRLCTAARSLLAHSQGCIVNTASMLSFFGGGLVPAYSASKGAVAQLTKSLAIAYAADGIRVNAIAPGWIATPLTQALQDDTDRSAVILGRTPMARWGTPADVAGPVLFLASPAAAFITGVILPVDGGYLIT
jgi:NAD(P)-dependent dehydrogenase (short-subunit alcohol dehydrogenase family)